MRVLIVVLYPLPQDLQKKRVHRNPSFVCNALELEAQRLGRPECANRIHGDLPFLHGDITVVTCIISSDITDVNMKIDNSKKKVYNHIEI